MLIKVTKDITINTDYLITIHEMAATGRIGISLNVEGFMQINLEFYNNENRENWLKKFFSLVTEGKGSFHEHCYEFYIDAEGKLKFEQSQISLRKKEGN